MFRIDNVTAAPALPAPGAAGTPGYFTNGDPVTNTPRTIVDQDWFNMTQEEIVAVILAAGLTLAKNDHTQLLQAINALIAEAIANTGTSSLLATNGYKIYTDGFIEQWGLRSGSLSSETTYEIDFPIAFPNACFGLTGMAVNAGASDAGVVTIQEVSLSTTKAIVFANNEAGAGAPENGIRWRAWGH